MMITFLYAGILTLLYIFLSFNVINKRRSNKIPLGDANNLELRQAIRAQGNFAEYTPIYLLILYFCELGGLQPFFLHLSAITFFLARILHFKGLTYNEKFSEGKLINGSKSRIRSMKITFFNLIFLSITLIFIYLIK